MERLCIGCKNPEDVRINFGDNTEAEREFHSKQYICMECRMRIVATFKRASEMKNNN